MDLLESIQEGEERHTLRHDDVLPSELVMDFDEETAMAEEAAALASGTLSTIDAAQLSRRNRFDDALSKSLHCWILFLHSCVSPGVCASVCRAVCDGWSHSLRRMGSVKLSHQELASLLRESQAKAEAGAPRSSRRKRHACMFLPTASAHWLTRAIFCRVGERFYGRRQFHGRRTWRGGRGSKRKHTFEGKVRSGVAGGVAACRTK